MPSPGSASLGLKLVLPDRAAMNKTLSKEVVLARASKCLGFLGQARTMHREGRVREVGCRVETYSSWKPGALRNQPTWDQAATTNPHVQHTQPSEWSWRCTLLGANPTSTFQIYNEDPLLAISYGQIFRLFPFLPGAQIMPAGAPREINTGCGMLILIVQCSRLNCFTHII